MTTSIKIEVTTDAIKIVNKTMKTEHVSKFVNRKLIIDGLSNGSRHRFENLSNQNLDVNIHSLNYLYTGRKSSNWCNKFNKIWQIWHNGATKHFSDFNNKFNSGNAYFYLNFDFTCILWWEILLRPSKAIMEKVHFTVQ